MVKFIVLLFLVFWLNTLAVLAQTTSSPDSVCAGSTDYYKISNPPSGSTFVWGIKSSGGKIISGQNTDSINVQWINTVGTDTLWVVETNPGGCKSDTSKLTVRRFARPTATINGNTSLCKENDGSEVTFTLTGIAPFTIVYKKNGIEQTQIVTSGNSFTIPATSLTITTVYELISLKDKLGIDNPVIGTATITVLSSLNPLQIIRK